MPTGIESTNKAIRAKNRCMKPPRLYGLATQTVVTARCPLGVSSKDKVPRFECKSLKGLQQAKGYRGYTQMGQANHRLPHSFFLPIAKNYFAFAAALMNARPFGTPHPVT